MSKLNIRGFSNNPIKFSMYNHGQDLVSTSIELNIQS